MLTLASAGFPFIIVSEGRLGGPRRSVRQPGIRSRGRTALLRGHGMTGFPRGVRVPHSNGTATGGKAFSLAAKLGPGTEDDGGRMDSSTYCLATPALCLLVTHSVEGARLLPDPAHTGCTNGGKFVGEETVGRGRADEKRPAKRQVREK